MTEANNEEGRWTLLTNHGAALIHVARRPDSTIREVADATGISERAAARILRDLRLGGYLVATRIGRRNAYHINLDQELRHPVNQGWTLADLLTGVVELEEVAVAPQRA